MYGKIEKSKSNEAKTSIIPTFCQRHKVGEADQWVANADKGAIIEHLDSIRQFGWVRLRMKQEYNVSHYTEEREWDLQHEIIAVHND